MVKFSSPKKVNKEESDLPSKERISPSRFMRKTSGRKRSSWKKLSSNSSISSVPSTNEVSNYAKSIEFTSSSSSQVSVQARILPISPKDRRTPSISVRTTRSTRKRNGWCVVDDLMYNRNRSKNRNGETMAPLLQSGITIPNSDTSTSTIGNQSVAEVVTEPTIVMESYNYYLIAGNRQVTYFPYAGNPYDCMNVLDYDVFPVYLGKDKCLIKVESSSVTYFDCIIRKEEWQGELKGAPDVPGFDAVGTILATGPDANFKKGDKVAAILGRGGNARYAVTKDLVKIENKDDVHEICGILSTYIAAFTLIHNGDNATDRYSPDYLVGKSVFVNGGMSSHGQAVIHLARLLGAKKIYATSRVKDHRHLRELGAMPLSLGSTEKQIELQNSFDLVIDLTTFDMYGFLLSLVKKPAGELIFSVHGDIAENGKHGVRSKLDFLHLKSKSLLNSEVHVCNYLDYTNRDDFFKSDFEYLRTMSRHKGNERLVPRIVATLSLDEIPHAHYKYETSNVRGIIVIDPWL